ncbi:MAG: peptide deformylase [Candidatus Omnitrophica bacterium]|nr:peptide deformylase [Candidatus Omnitrophota bacterium]
MPETALRLRFYPDPALRKRSVSVKQATDRHREILSAMSRIMYADQGIGLAAPQAGVNEAMIVVDIGQGLYKLINPKIVKRQGRQALEEGCLSVPGVCIKVRRSRKVWVRALDENARQLDFEAEDLFACVLQHEIDHLSGRLIIDHASFIDRLKIKKRLQELSRQANKSEGGIPPAYQAGLAGKTKNERVPESEAKSCKLQL